MIGMYLADLNIVNVKILVGDELIDGCISVEDGKILKIGKKPNIPRAEQTYDGNGLIAIPGLIDAHVHLRDLQLAYKEDFYTGTCAAAAGGFTTILDMPNTVPPTNTTSNLRLKIDSAKNKIVVNVGFHAGPAEDPVELQRMASAGIFSIKLYMNEASIGEVLYDSQNLTRMLREYASLKLPVTIHAEDGVEINKRMEKLKGKPLTIEEYSRIHSPEVELEAVMRILKSAEESGVKMHLCHLTLPSSLDAVRESRLRGVDVSCEVTPHHLFLTSRDLKKIGGWALSDPPLREPKEVQGLWDGISNLDSLIVASDHAPHSLMEKSASDMREVKPGIPGLETTLPLLLGKVNSGDLSLRRLIEVLAEKPAEIFGLKGKGRLSEGLDADIVLIDLEREHVVNLDVFHSKAKYSPFIGWRCKGDVSKVFLGGRLIFDEGEILAPPGSGSILECRPE
ncbi:MAG: dihydroorotase family protein [Candidatus Bathyarchaeia archaeon]|nr:dihydroorotase family protein [Candidatus Bathyarchaeota archaeon]